MKNIFIKFVCVFLFWAVIILFLWSNWYQHDWSLPIGLKFENFSDTDPEYFFRIRVFKSAFYDNGTIGLVATVEYCDKKESSACYHEKTELYYFEIDPSDYSVLKEIKLPVDEYTLYKYELISFIPKSKNIYWFDRETQSLNVFSLEDESLISEKIEKGTPPQFMYDIYMNITSTQIIEKGDEILMYNVHEFLDEGKLILYTFNKKLDLIGEDVVLSVSLGKGHIKYNCYEENTNTKCDQSLGNSAIYLRGVDSVEYKDTYVLKIVYMVSAEYLSLIEEEFKVEKKFDIGHPQIEGSLVVPYIISDDLKLQSIGEANQYSKYASDLNDMIVQGDLLFSIRSNEYFRFLDRDRLSSDSSYWSGMLLNIDRKLQMDLIDRIKNIRAGSVNLFTGSDLPWIEVTTWPESEKVYFFHVNAENEVIHRLKQKNADYSDVAPNDVIYLFNQNEKSMLYIQRSALGEVSFYELRSAVIVLFGIAGTFSIFMNPVTFIKSIGKRKLVKKKKSTRKSSS